jgi:ribosome biogenesis GTPase A
LIDLIPSETANEWIEYLSLEHPVVAFKASTQHQRRGIGQSHTRKNTKQAPTDIELASTRVSIGSDALMRFCFVFFSTTTNNKTKFAQKLLPSRRHQNVHHRRSHRLPKRR